MKELCKELLAACDAYHEALDRLFTRLILETRKPGNDTCFMPTRSGQPWDAATFGNVIRQKARQVLSRPDAEAIAAAPELAGKLAVVVYFNSEVQRDAFVDAACESMTNIRTVKVQ